MKGFLVRFTDAETVYCEGTSEYDAAKIAEKLSGKSIEWTNAYTPAPGAVQVTPYPTSGLRIVWQFEHPVHGATPPFCYRGTKCAGRTTCPNAPACTE